MSSTPSSDWTPSGVLIIGCGYSGMAIARLLTQRGIPVVGTTQNSDRFSEIERSGAIPLLYRIQPDLEPLRLPISIDHAVICVGPPWNDPYDPTGDLAKVLLSLELNRVVYLSSTSVYGDKQGAWVDEESECTPSSSAGIRRLNAENLLLSLYNRVHFPVIIARLPGIYGPGRSLLDRIRCGRFQLIDGHNSYSNRIHVDDLAQGVVAALHRGRTGRTYLLSDDEPALLSDVARYCSELLGIALPEPLSVDQATKEWDPSRRSLVMDSKRIRNDRFHTELGVVLTYPSYREGIRSVWESEQH